MAGLGHEEGCQEKAQRRLNSGCLQRHAGFDRDSKQTNNSPEKAAI
jgi:hypothetical protein